MDLIEKEISAFKNEVFLSEEEREEFKSVEDKYLNSECEALVEYLLNLRNNAGQKVELGQQENIFFSEAFHYVYFEKGRFYDIRGGFDCIADLIEGLDYFSCEEEVAVRFLSSF